MAGSTAGRGIPNSSELITGERTAVSNPTFQPNLYAPIKVEKLGQCHIACNEQCGH